MGYRESEQNQAVLTDSLNPLPSHLVKNKRNALFVHSKTIILKIYPKREAKLSLQVASKIWRELCCCFVFISQ